MDAVRGLKLFVKLLLSIQGIWSGSEAIELFFYFSKLKRLTRSIQKSVGTFGDTQVKKVIKNIQRGFECSLKL